MVNNGVYLALTGCLVVNNAIGLGIAVSCSRTPSGPRPGAARSPRSPDGAGSSAFASVVLPTYVVTITGKS